MVEPSPLRKRIKIETVFTLKDLYREMSQNSIVVIEAARQAKIEEYVRIFKARQKLADFVESFKKQPTFAYVDDDDAYKTYWDSVVAYPGIP